MRKTIVNWGLVAADKGWQERVEAAATFYSVHLGVAAMAVCSVGQHRHVVREAFLRRRSEPVRGVEVELKSGTQCTRTLNLKRLEFTEEADKVRHTSKVRH